MEQINLEEYLDTISTNPYKKIPIQIINTWEYFGYPCSKIFKSDLELLIQNVYPEIKLIENSNSRLSQEEFRSGLIIKFSGKCVITQNDSLDELEAAHIVEVKNQGNSTISNGLLLEANLHKTFDKYYWTINPDTLEIEVNPSNITRSKSIQNYIGKKILIQLDPFLYANLKKRYEIFLSKII